MEKHDLVVAAATRPFPGETANGDRWVVQWHAGSCRITLVDGLGHGPEAARAADSAAKVLQGNPGLSPGHVLLACHRALGGTRGAVGLSIVVGPDGRTLTYAGVGNVEGRIVWEESESHLISYRGILGAAIPTIHPFEIELGSQWLLVLHSDGVSDRFGLGDGRFSVDEKPGEMASRLLREWGRVTDDATVVVVRPRWAVAG